MPKQPNFFRKEEKEEVITHICSRKIILIGKFKWISHVINRTNISWLKIQWMLSLMCIYELEN